MCVVKFHAQNTCVCGHSKAQSKKKKGSHARSRDCVSAWGRLPKGGGVKKFRRGRGPQVLSLEPGGGVEGGKKIRQADHHRGEGEREEACISPPNLLP